MINMNHKPNLLKLLLTARYTAPDDFQPDTEFYHKTHISRRRFKEIYKGTSPISGREYAAVAKFLGLTKREAQETRQLKIWQ